jgi:hypothetical protein
VSLIATFPVAKNIQDKFDSVGYSQFLEDSVDVVSDGMFFHFESLSDFAVLQSVCNEANYVFFAARQKRHSLGII